MNRSVLSISLLLALAAPPLSAAESPPVPAEGPFEGLTLEQALALSGARSPLLAVAEAETRASQGRLRQSGQRPNPELAISQENLFNDDLAGFDGRSRAYELEQSFELGGRRSARRGVAQAGVERAGWDLAAARLDVANMTTQAFHAAVTAEGRVGLARETLELALRVEEMVRARVEAGSIAPMEGSRAAIAVASVRIELAGLEEELQVDRARLAATWGGQPTVASVTGQLADPGPLPPLEALERLLPDSPDLARWTAELRERESLVQLARSQAAPDFAISVGWTDYEQANESAWLVGFRIGLPFADRNQGGISEAVALREKAEAERLLATSDARFRLAAAHRRASVAAATAQALATDVLPAAHLGFESATTGYTAGKLPYLDVLEARRTLLDLQRAHLDAVAAHHAARAELLRLVGGAALTTAGPDATRTENK